MMVLLALSTLHPVRGVPSTARITGTVLDSLHNEPLAGARIVISGSNRAALTDDKGYFSIDSLDPGTYDVFVQHALIDSLGLRIAARGVKVAESAPAKVLLAIPGITKVRRMLCGEADSSGGIITGRVVRAGTTDGIPSANVVLTWFSMGAEQKTLEFLPGAAQTITDDRGYYAFCALPADFEASIEASNDKDTTAMIPVSLAWSSIGIVSQRLALSGSLAAVSGVVVDSAGNAIGGATVDVPGVKSKATSKPDGSFTIVDVPAGTRIVRGRMVGYTASMVPVEAGSSDHVRIALGPALSKLAPVIVRAIRSDVADRTGFSKRMLTGPGKYASGEQLIAAKAVCIVDALRHSMIWLTRGPGCSIEQVGTHQWRGVSSLQGLLPALPAGEAAKKPTASVAPSGCMLIYVDDIPEAGGETLDLSWLHAEEVVGIEFYSAASAPARIGQTTCNVLMIWTMAYHGAHH